MVLWSYAIEGILPLCKEFEEKLIKHIWRTRDVSARPDSIGGASLTSGSGIPYSSNINIQALSPDGSQIELNEKSGLDHHIEGVIKEEPDTSAEPSSSTTAAPKKGSWWSWKLQSKAPGLAGGSSGASEGDTEKGGIRKERKLVLIGPIYAGLGASLAACAFSLFCALLIRFCVEHKFSFKQTSCHRAYRFSSKNTG